MYAHLFPLRERFLILLLLFAQLALVSRVLWSVSPPGLIMPVVTVAAPDSELVHTRLSPYGPGFEREMVTGFAQQTGVHPIWVHLDGPQAALDQARQGRADLVVGLHDASSPSAHRVSSALATGPVYAKHPVAIVHQRRYNGLSDYSELCTRQLLIPGTPSLRKISTDLLDEYGCSAPVLTADDTSLQNQFAAMRLTESRFTIVDMGRYRLWKPFFPNYQLADYLHAEIGYRWYWRSTAPAAKLLTSYWQDLEQVEPLAELKEKYFGFFPDRIDRFELYHFIDALKNELPRYRDVIIEAARRYEIDPFLLVALIYHESRFDHQAVSRTGVRGIMQITQATAQGLGLDNPEDPRQSILAGARYLRQIWNRVEREGMQLSHWDRWFLALSAYNQGLGHTWDAMDLAHDLGLAGTSWKSVKQVFPLLSQQEYYSRARHGRTRGGEAVAHVEAVRYYYYVLHGLFNLGRDEREHFGRLGLTAHFS